MNEKTYNFYRCEVDETAEQPLSENTFKNREYTKNDETTGRINGISFEKVSIQGAEYLKIPTFYKRMISKTEYTISSMKEDASFEPYSCFVDAYGNTLPYVLVGCDNVYYDNLSSKKSYVALIEDIINRNSYMEGDTIAEQSGSGYFAYDYNTDTLLRDLYLVSENSDIGDILGNISTKTVGSKIYYFLLSNIFAQREGSNTLKWCSVQNYNSRDIQKKTLIEQIEYEYSTIKTTLSGRLEVAVNQSFDGFNKDFFFPQDIRTKQSQETRNITIGAAVDDTSILLTYCDQQQQILEPKNRRRATTLICYKPFAHKPDLLGKSFRINKDLIIPDYFPPYSPDNGDYTVVNAPKFRVESYYEPSQGSGEHVLITTSRADGSRYSSKYLSATWRYSDYLQFFIDPYLYFNYNKNAALYSPGNSYLHDIVFDYGSTELSPELAGSYIDPVFVFFFNLNGEEKKTDVLYYLRNNLTNNYFEEITDPGSFLMLAGEAKLNGVVPQHDAKTGKSSSSAKQLVGRYFDTVKWINEDKTALIFECLGNPTFGEGQTEVSQQKPGAPVAFWGADIFGVSEALSYIRNKYSSITESTLSFDEGVGHLYFVYFTNSSNVEVTGETAPTKVISSSAITNPHIRQTGKYNSNIGAEAEGSFTTTYFEPDLFSDAEFTLSSIDINTVGFYSWLKENTQYQLPQDKFLLSEETTMIGTFGLSYLKCAKLVIPTQINELGGRSIVGNAASEIELSPRIDTVSHSCLYNNYNMVTLLIPSSVKNIRGYAAARCYRLKKVIFSIPDIDPTIEEGSTYNTWDENNIHFNQASIVIPSSTFSGSSSLRRKSLLYGGLTDWVGNNSKGRRRFTFSFTQSVSKFDFPAENNGSIPLPIDGATESYDNDSMKNFVPEEYISLKNKVFSLAGSLLKDNTSQSEYYIFSLATIPDKMNVQCFVSHAINSATLSDANIGDKIIDKGIHTNYFMADQIEKIAIDVDGQKRIGIKFSSSKVNTNIIFACDFSGKCVGLLSNKNGHTMKIGSENYDANSTMLDKTTIYLSFVGSLNKEDIILQNFVEGATQQQKVSEKLYPPSTHRDNPTIADKAMWVFSNDLALPNVDLSFSGRRPTTSPNNDDMQSIVVKYKKQEGTILQTKFVSRFDFSNKSDEYFIIYDADGPTSEAKNIPIVLWCKNGTALAKFKQKALKEGIGGMYVSFTDYTSSQDFPGWIFVEKNTDTRYSLYGTEYVYLKPTFIYASADDEYDTYDIIGNAPRTAFKVEDSNPYTYGFASWLYNNAGVVLRNGDTVNSATHKILPNKDGYFNQTCFVMDDDIVDFSPEFIYSNDKCSDLILGNSLKRCIGIDDINSNYWPGSSDYQILLKRVFINRDLSEIGRFFFFNQQQLENTYVDNIYSSLTKIGSSAFGLCKNLTTIPIVKNLSEIGQQCFYGTAITNLILQENIKTLGNSCFQNCNDLSSIIIRYGQLEKIPAGCFNECDKLDDPTKTVYIELPSSIKEIQKNAFSDADFIVQETATTITTGFNATNTVIRFNGTQSEYNNLLIDFSYDTSMTGRILVSNARLAGEIIIGNPIIPVFVPIIKQKPVRYDIANTFSAFYTTGAGGSPEGYVINTDGTQTQLSGKKIYVYPATNARLPNKIMSIEGIYGIDGDGTIIENIPENANRLYSWNNVEGCITFGPNTYIDPSYDQIVISLYSTPIRILYNSQQMTKTPTQIFIYKDDQRMMVKKIILNRITLYERV